MRGMKTNTHGAYGDLRSTIPILQSYSKSSMSTPGNKESSAKVCSLRYTNELNEFIEQRGKILFDRKDIERCLEFQSVLKERFRKELRLLDPNSVTTAETASSDQF